MKILIEILLFFMLAAPIGAHPGYLDEKGGHKCWTNCENYNLKYGEYHIHRQPEPVQQKHVELETEKILPAEIPSEPLENIPKKTSEPKKKYEHDLLTPLILLTGLLICLRIYKWANHGKPMTLKELLKGAFR